MSNTTPGIGPGRWNKHTLANAQLAHAAGIIKNKPQYECECPYDSVTHRPHACNGRNVARYLRHGKEIFLCGDCRLPGDYLAN